MSDTSMEANPGIKTATTADGRVLEIKELSPGQMLDLIEASGSAGASASASAWLGFATMVCSVTSIDGVPVMFPTTKGAVRNLADKLGNDGIVAVNRALAPDASASADDDRAEIKN